MTSKVGPAQTAWHLENVEVPRAWEHTRGRGVIVAVIDDGVDIKHPEFEDRVVGGINVDEPACDATPPPWESHGTKVAGVACAGGVDVFGVAPGAFLMPIRMPSVRHDAFNKREAQAFRYAATKGADVICCAWGPPADRLGKAQLPLATRRSLERAVRHGRSRKGCIIVMAAGNEGASVDDNPYACHPATLVAGACNDQDRHPAYSNTGNALHCVFPSSDPTDTVRHRDVVTTAPTGSFRYGETWYTDSFGLTSAACAGVAGLCALILSANPDLYWWEVKEVIRDSCVKIDAESGTYDENGYSPLYGYGRPDAGVAVQLAMDRKSRSTT